MSEPQEEVFAPYEVTLDPPVSGIETVTVTREDDGYYVFSTADQSGLTALKGDPADPATDIAAAIEAWHSLDALKEQKLAEIAEACRAEYTATLETSFGAPFHATGEAILDVMNIIARLEPEQVYPGYKGADDIWRDLTREQFQLALDEGANRKAASFAKRKTLTDQIEAATTQAELQTITW